MKTNGAIWKKLWEQKERSTLREAWKSCFWVEQREDRKADENMKVNKWAELYKALKWNNDLSIQLAMEMLFCAVSSKPGSSQAAFSLSLSVIDHCITTSLKTSFLKWIFTINDQNMSHIIIFLYFLFQVVKTWNCKWYLKTACGIHACSFCGLPG